MTSIALLAGLEQLERETRKGRSKSVKSCGCYKYVLYWSKILIMHSISN